MAKDLLKTEMVGNGTGWSVSLNEIFVDIRFLTTNIRFHRLTYGLGN